MESKEGREIYAFRKITVEPVIGNLKENFRFRRFSLRGLDGARLELDLVSIVHNLKKIWVMGGKVGVNCGNQRKNVVFWFVIGLGEIDSGTGSGLKQKILAGFSHILAYQEHLLMVSFKEIEICRR